MGFLKDREKNEFGSLRKSAVGIRPLLKPSLKKKGGVINDPSTSQKILSEVLSK